MTLWLPLVDVVKQSEKHTCGPATLSAVMRAFGCDQPSSEADLAHELGTGPGDGTRPEALAAVAQQHGFAAQVREGLDVHDLEAPLRGGALAILGVQWPERPWRKAGMCVEGHYVVYLGSVKSRVYVMDPLHGYGWVKESELLANWRDRCGGTCRERLAVFVQGDPARHRLERVAFREKEFKHLKTPRQRNPGHRDEDLMGLVHAVLSTKHDLAAWQRLLLTAKRRGFVVRALTQSNVEIDVLAAEADAHPLAVGGVLLAGREPGSTWVEWITTSPVAGIDLVPTHSLQNPPPRRQQAGERLSEKEIARRERVAARWTGALPAPPKPAPVVRRCACGRPVPAGQVWCFRCRPPVLASVCPTCGQGTPAGSSCPRCVNPSELPLCPNCEITLTQAAGIRGFSCNTCLRFFPGDSAWLGRGAANCRCGKKAEPNGMCYRCNQKMRKAQREFTKAAEREEKRQARIAKHEAAKLGREARKRPPEEGQRSW